MYRDPGICCRLLARDPRVGAAGGALQRVVHQQPRDAAFLPARVESVGRRRRRHDDEVHLAFAQRALLGARLRRSRTVISGCAASACRIAPVSAPGAMPTSTGLAAAGWKRDRHRHRHDDRKDESPEERLGLAHELAERASVSSTQRTTSSSLIAQVPPGQPHEHVLQRAVPWVTTVAVASDAISSCGVPSAMTRP